MNEEKILSETRIESSDQAHLSSETAETTRKAESTAERIAEDAAAPIVASPIDNQTLNNPNAKHAATQTEQSSTQEPERVETPEERKAKAAEAQKALSARFILRRGKLSEEQLAQRKARLANARRLLARSIQTNGAGQALAWLESQGAQEDYALIRETLCNALGLSQEEAQKEGSLVATYAKRSSLEALSFRAQLLATLDGLELEVE